MQSLRRRHHGRPLQTKQHSRDTRQANNGVHEDSCTEGTRGGGIDAELILETRFSRTYLCTPNDREIARKGLENEDQEHQEEILEGMLEFVQ